MPFKPDSRISPRERKNPTREKIELSSSKTIINRQWEKRNGNDFWIEFIFQDKIYRHIVFLKKMFRFVGKILLLKKKRNRKILIEINVRKNIIKHYFGNFGEKLEWKNYFPCENGEHFSAKKDQVIRFWKS